MAVIDLLPGVEVAVTVDGVDLKEHQDLQEQEEDRCVTSYLEVEKDQAFAVRINVTPDLDFEGDSLSFEVYVDGQRARSPNIKKKHVPHEREVGGIYEGRDMLRKFYFTSVETVSDNRMLLTEPSRVKDLGSVVVKVKHVFRRGRGKGVTRHKIQDLSFVSEKAIKGQSVSHGVSLTEAVYNKQGSSWNTTPVDGVPNPYATFVFRYRSTQALKSMLMIPRTPSPPPPIPIEQRDPTTLSLDELRQLQQMAKELAKQKEDQIRIKQEKADESPRPRKRVRPSAGDTQLELGEDGSVREGSTSTLAAAEREVIELD